jgi:acetolactate synthase-1/2/3 large subunit
MTKYAVQINDPLMIKYHLQKACSLATSGRPGPVWLDIPLDVQSAQIDPESLIEYRDSPPLFSCSEEDIQIVYEKLQNAKNPLLIVGNGIRLSHAIDALYKLIETLQIPTISAVNGNDIVTSNYPFYCGRFGTHAQICANKLLSESDLVISIGSRLYVRQTGYNFKSFAQNAYKIYVDIDKNELDKPTLFPDLKIHSDAKIFIDKLNKLNLSKVNQTWSKYAHDLYNSTKKVLDKHRNNEQFVSHYAFMEHLSRLKPRDTHIVTSDGSANVVTMQVMDLCAGQRLITNTGSAPMGYGLPCAIGASINHKIICIEGDGSLHLNLNALETMKHYNLPIKLILLNNQGYLSIKITQDNFFNGKYVASESSSGVTFPEFKKIFDAYEIKYLSIKNHNEIHSRLTELFAFDGPCVCEIFTDPKEYHEPKVIAKLDENGKFIPGKLEDIQWITQ